MVDMTAAPLGRPFWTFWSAGALANLGDGIRVAAFPLLAASLSANPVAVAAVAAAQALPWLVAGLAAGALADRRGARAVIAAADVGRVLLLAILTVAVATGWATVTLVVVTAFALGVGETVRDTAAQTAVPKLVPPEHLERANGRIVAGEILGNEFFGPPLGAMLFVVGAAVPFAVNGTSLALAVMLVLSLPLTLLSRPARQDNADRDGVLDGLRWLWRHRLLRTLAVVCAAAAAADSAWFAIFVLYAQQSLHLGPLGFGVLLGIGAGGGLAGSLAADRMVRWLGQRRALALSVAAATGTPALLIVAPNRFAAAVVVVATSAAFAVVTVAAVSLRQRLVPDRLLGRVVAASRTLIVGASALGALLGGGLAAAGGSNAPFVLCAAIAVLATASWWRATRP